MELGGVLGLSFHHHSGPTEFVNFCVCIICSWKFFCPGSASSQSSDLESALRRTLFTAALFNELKSISVVVEMFPLFESTSSDFDFSVVAVYCLMF